MVLISLLEYLASRMRLILFVPELKGVLFYDSANVSFVVESMLRQGIVALSL